MTLDPRTLQCGFCHKFLDDERRAFLEQEKMLSMCKLCEPEFNAKIAECLPLFEQMNS